MYRILLIYIGLFCVALLPFLPSLPNPLYIEWDDGNFVLNDKMSLTWENISYWATHATMGTYTPLAMYSLMLDRWVCGTSSFYFRLINIIFHGVNACLFCYLLHRLGCRRMIAAMVALLFAIHPQRMESVIWICERRDLLFAFFYLLAVIFFILDLDRGRNFSVTALLCTALSFFAKPMGISVPLILSFYMIYRNRSLAPWPVLRVTWPYFLMTMAVYFVFTRFSTMAPMEEWLRIPVIVLHNLAWYIFATLFPVDINPLRPRVMFEPATWCLIGSFLALILAMLVTVFGGGRRIGRSLPLYAVIAFWGIYGSVLLPVLGLFRFSHSDYCDRYSYLPAMVILSAIALWLSSCQFTVRPWFRFAAAGYAVYLLLLTISNLGTWRDSVTLFRAAASAPLPNYRAIIGLAEVGFNRQQPHLTLQAGKLLLDYSRQARERQLPESVFAPAQCYSAGLALYGIGLAGCRQYEMAISPLAELVELQRQNRLRLISPELTFIPAYSQLAAAYLHTGRTAQSIETLTILASSLPERSVEQYFFIGQACYLKGNYIAARNAYMQADKLRPNDRRSRENLKQVEAKIQAAASAPSISPAGE